MIQRMCTTKWYADQRYIYAYKSTKTLRGIDVDGAVMGFNIENLTAKQALLDAKNKRRGHWLCGFWCLVPLFCMCSRSLFDLNGECIQMTDNASSLFRLC